MLSSGAGSSSASVLMDLASLVLGEITCSLIGEITGLLIGEVTSPLIARDPITEASYRCLFCCGVGRLPREKGCLMRFMAAGITLNLA